MDVRACQLNPDKYTLRKFSRPLIYDGELRLSMEKRENWNGETTACGLQHG